MTTQEGINMANYLSIVVIKIFLLHYIWETNQNWLINTENKSISIQEAISSFTAQDYAIKNDIKQKKY